MNETFAFDSAPPKLKKELPQVHPNRVEPKDDGLLLHGFHLFRCQPLSFDLLLRVPSGKSG